MRVLCAVYVNEDINHATIQSKGIKVKLSTFKSWAKEDVLGFKTEEFEGTTYVVFIWCEVCSCNLSLILLHPTCRGEAKIAMKTFIDQTNGVTKYNVDRHLKGKATK